MLLYYIHNLVFIWMLYAIITSFEPFQIVYFLILFKLTCLYSLIYLASKPLLFCGLTDSDLNAIL